MTDPAVIFAALGGVATGLLIVILTGMAAGIL